MRKEYFVVKSNKLYKKNLKGNISFKGSLIPSYIKYIELYYKTNPKLLIIALCITIVLSLSGYILSGLVWTLIILAISILFLLLFPSVETPFTKTKNLKIK